MEKEATLECPSCQSYFVEKQGYDYDSTLTLYECEDCGHCGDITIFEK